jgi:hypothetical protein
LIPARSIRSSTLSLWLKWQAQPIGVLWYTWSRIAGLISACRVERPEEFEQRGNTAPFAEPMLPRAT